MKHKRFYQSLTQREIFKSLAAEFHSASTFGCANNTKVKQMADSVSYEYDLNGRLKKLTFANADEVNVQYDDMGNREEVEITIAPPLRPLTAGTSSPATTQSSAVIDDKSDSSDK